MAVGNEMCILTMSAATAKQIFILKGNQNALANPAKWTFTLLTKNFHCWLQINIEAAFQIEFISS